MRNRVAVVLSVLALMGGWGGGMGSRSAAGTPKAYVGLFKEDAVAPPLNREPDPGEPLPPTVSLGSTSVAPPACRPPGMPPLGELVSVGQQILVASVEGSDETVTVDAIALVVRDHLARYRGDDEPPDFIAYYVRGHLAAVYDHPGDPAERDLVDTGMVSLRGAALAQGTPSCW